MLLPFLLAVQAMSPSMPGMDHTACAATPAAPPIALRGWSPKRAVNAGMTAGSAMLPIGSGITATLVKTPLLTFTIPPEKAGTVEGYGGIFTVLIKAPGRYRIALGAGAWIDLVSNGATVASASHGHGPECTGIRKMVDFDLKPGRYLLQLSGNAAPTLDLMVARL